jgi:hypothetical protein
MHVYIASSWDNLWVEGVKRAVHSLGHTYYHFSDSPYALDYNHLAPDFRKLPGSMQAKGLRSAMVMRARNANMAELARSQAFVLIEPAGKGSYTEFGIAASDGMRTFLFVTPEYQIGVMDALFTHVVFGVTELKALL